MAIASCGAAHPKALLLERLLQVVESRRYFMNVPKP
jgi:hypothetical protein